MFSSWSIPAPDGALSAFASSTSGEVVTAWQVVPGGDWVGWLGIGGEPAGRPVVAREPAGGLSLFVRTGSGEVATAPCPQPGARWSRWKALGGNIADDPVAVVRPDGALALFAVATTGGSTPPPRPGAVATGPNGTTSAVSLSVGPPAR